MNFLRRLFQKPIQSPDDPVSLRTQLFQAAQRGDHSALLSLCREHRETIRQHFPKWTNMQSYGGVDPTDTSEVQSIVNGLGGIAETFRDKLGDSSLWEHLAGPAESNPFKRFEEALEQARKLTAGLQYEQAIDLLTAYLIEIKDLQGTASDNFRAYGHGMIGNAMFQSNRASDALPHFQQALSLCMKLADRDGVGTYLRNLHDAHRYLGQTKEAAEYADQLADFWRGTPDAELWQTRAALVRAGEPPVRMVAERDGRIMELSQLSTMGGKTRFLFERNRPTLVPASQLVRRGNELAAQEKYDEALGFYREATKADPYDPDPHYQAGITLLLLQRYPQAIEEYEQVTTLAPGWFNAVNDLWVAQELLAGRLAHDAFFVAWAFEHNAMKPAEKLKMVEQAISRFPHFVNLHLQRALTLRALSLKEQACAALDEALAMDPEPEIRSRLLAQRAVLSGAADQQRYWSEILQIPHANLMSRTMAELMLRHPMKSQ